jgi:hypothetical protein
MNSLASSPEKHYGLVQTFILNFLAAAIEPLILISKLI